MPSAPAAGDVHADPDSPLVTATGNPSLAAETRRLYAADWDSFARWCRIRNVPASADAVAAFLAGLAATHRPGSGRRRLAAIAFEHRSAGHMAPDSPAGRAALRAPRSGDRPPAASRTTPVQLVRAATRCPGDPAGLRDRALLLLLACSGLGRGRNSPPRLRTAASRTVPAGATTPDGVVQSYRMWRLCRARRC